MTRTPTYNENDLEEKNAREAGQESRDKILYEDTLSGIAPEAPVSELKKNCSLLLWTWGIHGIVMILAGITCFALTELSDNLSTLLDDIGGWSVLFEDSSTYTENTTIVEDESIMVFALLIGMQQYAFILILPCILLGLSCVIAVISAHKKIYSAYKALYILGWIHLCAIFPLSGWIGWDSLNIGLAYFESLQIIGTDLMYIIMQAQHIFFTVCMMSFVIWIQIRTLTEQPWNPALHTQNKGDTDE